MASRSSSLAKVKSWWWMAAGLMLVAGVGWWDDHRPLWIAVRLSAHFVAGAALAWSLSLQET